MTPSLRAPPQDAIQILGLCMSQGAESAAKHSNRGCPTRFPIL
jgi:hypothetical protein